MSKKTDEKKELINKDIKKKKLNLKKEKNKKKYYLWNSFCKFNI